MRKTRHPVHILGIFSAALLGFACSGCGGGGGGGAAAPAPSGTVSVLIADGPTLEFDHIWVDIDRVSLIPAGDGKPAVVFQGSETIDLLRFQDEEFLLASAAEVPSGRYEKIRLEISRITVDPDADCPQVKLPSGKIDLNPRGAFVIDEGGSLVVRIDIDAAKSISIHQAGNSGKCIFRPVVFVDVLSGHEGCRQEIAGTITGIDTGEDLEPRDDDDDLDGDGEHHAGEHRDPRALAVLDVDLGEGRGTVHVAILPETDVFDDHALPADLAVLDVGDAVRARGIMTGHDELRATWAIEGRPAEVRGSFESAIADGAFDFDAGDGGAIDGRTTAGTAAYGACDAPVALDGISAGARARILGTSISEGETSFFRAAVIDVGPAEVRGEITAIDGSSVTVQPAGGDPVSFEVLGTTEIVLVGGGALSADDLRTGQTVTARLAPGAGSATRIAVEPESASGTVADLDAEAGTFRLVGEPPAADIEVVLDSLATVLLIEDDDHIRQVDPSELAGGDDVTLFGLVPAAGAFDARTVVIRR